MMQFVAEHANGEIKALTSLPLLIGFSMFKYLKFWNIAINLLPEKIFTITSKFGTQVMQ